MSVTVLYSCGLLSVMYAMTFAPFFPDRAKLCGVLFAIILMCNRYMLLDFNSDLVKKISAIFMVCLLLANVRDFGDALKSTKRYEHEINKRIEYIEKNGTSLRGLSEMLKADEFCEYLRDRNIPFTKF